MPESDSVAAPPSQGKNAFKESVLALLVLALLVAGVWAAKGPLAKLAAGMSGEPVEVVGVVVDRDNRAFLDLIFDRPLGEGLQGDVLASVPATLTPPLAGNWRWRDVNVLRFEPSGGFGIASVYGLELIPERLLREKQRFASKTRFEVKTDEFLVEAVEVVEEPAQDTGGKVTLSGVIRFNYDVEPETLAPLLSLEDDEAEAGRGTVELADAYWRDDALSFRTSPVQKTRAERTVALRIGGNLTPAEGNVPLGRDFVYPILLGSRDKLAVRSVRAEPGAQESRVMVEFSSPVSATAARPFFKVTPETSFRVTADRNRLTLTGPFKPGASYGLEIGQGLPALDEAVLQEASTHTLQLADLPASVDFESQGFFLSARGPKAVALTSVNVQQVRLAVDRVYRNNLFAAIEYGGEVSNDSTYAGDVIARSFGDRLAETTITIPAARNVPGRTVVPLEPYLEDGARGLYRVMVNRPGEWQAKQRWLLVTDLGAVAKKGAGELLVWAANTRSLQPAAGAEVVVLSDQNQTIGRGRTDASGFYRLTDAAAFEKHRPFLVTVDTGADFTFLYLDRMGVDVSGLDVAGVTPRGDGHTAFLYGERDLYRPGETAHGAVIVRTGGIAAPPAMPARLRHRDPQGRELSARTLNLDGRGLAEYSLDLPPYALTGNHVLELEVADEVIGSYSFQVEEFVPDRIKVEIQPATAAAMPGQSFAYDVTSRYLFGPPAGGLGFESRVRLVRAAFEPEGFEAFTFGDREREWTDREVFRREGTLDAEGRQRLEVASLTVGNVPASLSAVITARVSEAGGRGVTAWQRVPVHPYPAYVGLRRLGEGYPEPGQEVAFEVVAVSPEGKAVDAAELQAELIYERWSTVLRQTSNGTYRYESTKEPVPVSVTTLKAGAKRGSFKVRPGDYGRHKVLVSDPATGAAAALWFDVVGWGYSPWAIANPARVELELEKAEYAPGEAAVVQVRAPFPGKLLLTVEREQVLLTQVHTLSGNTARIEVPISGAWRPNVYLTAMLVRSVDDLEPGSVSRAFGALTLPVDRLANRLEVAFDAPEEVRSQTRVPVEVRTTPGAAVTIAAVDEGILQLIGQKLPDPFEFFYQKLALAVDSYDTFSLLLPDVAIAGKAKAGGGEMGEDQSQYVSADGLRRAKPVAFWSGIATADGNGRARLELELPEFQGALRLMAVAIDGRRFGGAEAMTRVRDPLVLLPTLPRVLSYGEKVELPLTLRNDTGKTGSFELRLAATGAARVAEPATRTVEVANAAEATAYFTLETAESGADVELVFTATGNGEKQRSTGAVSLRPDLPAVAVHELGTLDKATTSLALAGGPYRPGTETRHLRLGSLPLVQVSGRLRDLLDYPYGCLEQTVSRAFPLIHLGELARELEPDLLDPAKGGAPPEAMVEDAIRRVARLQLPVGGFSLWPEGTEADLFSSLYATHFLVEAQRAGYVVDSYLQENALAFASAQVRAKPQYGQDELERMVYALYVLARAGQGDLGAMDQLRREQKANLAPDFRALLAAAYAAVGDRAAVAEIVAHLGQIDKVERQTGQNLRSALRSHALLLLALLDADPQSAAMPAAVDRLSRELTAWPWWSTQETSWVLLALGQLAERQAARGPFAGKVVVGGKTLGSFSSKKTPNFARVPGSEPVQVEMAGAYTPGAAFYALTSRGIPTEAAFKPVANGIEVERELLTREQGAVAGAVTQGDLVVLRTRVRSVSGPLSNVVLQQLLPSGLEIENPRLETTETLPWVTDAGDAPAYADLRDDRVLLFVDLPANSWRTYYAVVRAVTPGVFRLPPVHAEAMYSPDLRATGQRSTLEVRVRARP